MTSRDDVTRDVGGMWAVLSMEREASTAFTFEISSPFSLEVPGRNDNLVSA